jgi:hypothetical protein
MTAGYMMEKSIMGASEKSFKGGVIKGKSGSVITVSTSGGDKSLKINADTTITVNRLYRGLGDLGKGQSLKSVYYYDGSGTVVATVVHAIDKELLKKQQAEQKKGSEGGDGQAKPAI